MKHIRNLKAILVNNSPKRNTHEGPLLAIFF